MEITAWLEGERKRGRERACEMERSKITAIPAPLIAFPKTDVSLTRRRFVATRAEIDERFVCYRRTDFDPRHELRPSTRYTRERNGFEHFFFWSRS